MAPLRSSGSIARLLSSVGVRQAIAAALLLAALVQTGQAQREAGAPASEGMFLDVDAAAAKKLAAARELVAARQWGDAIELIRQVGEQHGPRLVAHSPRLYVTVQMYCDLVLSSLPPEGLAAYRQRTDPQARRWFEDARRERDEQALQRILARAFVSSYGDDTLLLLGDLAWEAGDLPRARGYWEKLLPPEATSPAGNLPDRLRYPDASIEPAAIRARLVLCSVLQRPAPQAARELAEFRRLYPEAQGILAGTKANLGDTLAFQAELARKSGGWPRAVEAETFAGNPRRQTELPKPVDVGAVLWSVALDEFRIDATGRRTDDRFGDLPVPRPLNLIRQRVAGGPTQEALSYFPIVHGNLLLYCSDRAIYARDLLSDKPGQGAWGGDAAIFRLPREFGEALPAQSRRAGIPQFTLSVADNRVYARLGSLSSRGGVPGALSADSALVCLDLARQGDLTWQVKAHELPIEGGGWIFDGAPLPAGDRVYATLRRHEPQLQLNVACFEARSGKMVWNRKIGLGLENLGGDFDEIHHQLLSIADERLYYCTNSGAVAALDARDGAVRWIAAYPRAEIPTISDFNRRQQHGPNPCVIDGGRLYAAPADCDRVLAFDAESGRVLWSSEPRGNAHQIVGISSGRLIVAGDMLSALSIDDGRAAWTIGQSTPEAATYGRGALAGGLVYWPRREEIQLVDVATGKIRREVALAQQHGLAGGGNIVLADGLMVLAQSNRLSVFGEYGGLKKSRENEVALAPESIDAWLRLGLVEAAMQHPDAALQALRRACDNTSDADLREASCGDESHGYLVRLLVAHARQHSEAGDLPSAVALLEEALQVSEPARRHDIRRRLAEHWQQAREPRQAIAVWQAAMDEAAARRAGAGMARGTADQAAAREIDRLIAQAGRDAYLSVEQAAADRFTAALDRGDLGRIQALLWQYPHSDAALDAARRLGRMQRESNDTYGSDWTWHWLLENSRSERRDRVLALSGLALNAFDRGHWRSAALWWQQLYELAPGAKIAVDGPEGAPADFAAILSTRRAEQAAARLADSDAGEPHERVWNRPLNPGARTVVPEGAPPAPESGCVLISDGFITCLDGRNGTPRWRLGVSEPAEWAGFVADLLVLVTRSSVLGIVPEDGRLVWEFPLGSSSVRGITAARCLQTRDDLFVLTAGADVCRLYPQDGRIAWRYRPARGEVRPTGCAVDGRVVVRISSPDHWQVLDAEAGALVAEFDAPPGKPVEPLPLGDGKAVGLVSGAQKIQVIDPALGRAVSTYQGPVSTVYAVPELLPAPSAALALIDATTLTRFDPRSGQRLWSRRFGSRQVGDDARGSTCGDGERIYVVSAGVLRGISLADGRLLWEQYLGPADWSWCVTRTASVVAAWPRAGEEGVSVTLCDPASGRFLERLNFSSSVEVRVHEVGSTTIVASNAMICGLTRHISREGR